MGKHFQINGSNRQRSRNMSYGLKDLAINPEMRINGRSTIIHSERARDGDIEFGK